MGLQARRHSRRSDEVFAQRDIGPPEFLAIGLIIAALSFKIALVPFHAWTPDAYDGAPTAVTAFISVAPKIAALGLLLRLLAVSFEPYAVDLEVLLGVLAAVTIVVGNLVAVAQTNVKRMLAYSSIAHSGYMLAGLDCHTDPGWRRVDIRWDPHIALLRGCLRTYEYRRVRGRDAC